MYRSYFQLSSNLLTNFLTKNQLPVSVTYERFLQKRWAGHSKWANIKHTKAAKDQSKSTAFQKLSQRMALAVKEGGADPAGNVKLKSLIEEAKKINMPNATIQNAIKAGKENASEPYWLLYVSNSGLSVAFEVNCSSIQHAISRISQFAKRLLLKHEKHTKDFYEERGLLVCDPLQGMENAFDKALEDAIDIGIEEVFENDDKSLLFECVPTMLSTALRKLEDKGYTVHSASTELNFTKYIRLDKEGNENLNLVIDLAQKNFPHILRVSTNVEQ